MTILNSLMQFTLDRVSPSAMGEWLLATGDSGKSRLVIHKDIARKLKRGQRYVFNVTETIAPVKGIHLPALRSIPCEVGASRALDDASISNRPQRPDSSPGLAAWNGRPTTRKGTAVLRF